MSQCSSHDAQQLSIKVDYLLGRQWLVGKQVNDVINMVDNGTQYDMKTQLQWLTLFIGKSSTVCQKCPYTET